MLSAWLAAHKDQAATLGSLTSFGIAVAAVWWARRFRTQQIIQARVQAAIEINRTVGSFFIAVRRFVVNRGAPHERELAATAVTELDAARSLALLFFKKPVADVLGEALKTGNAVMTSALTNPLPIGGEIAALEPLVKQAELLHQALSFLLQEGIGHPNTLEVRRGRLGAARLRLAEWWRQRRVKPPPPGRV